MLSYATASMLVALSAFLVAAAVIIASILRTSIFRSEFWGDVFGVMAIIFFAASLAAQGLVAFTGHTEALKDWQLVGLYFTAICVFASGIPLMIFFVCDLLMFMPRQVVPDRLLEACVPVFGICWVAELIILLSR